MDTSDALNTRSPSPSASTERSESSISRSSSSDRSNTSIASDCSNFLFGYDDYPNTSSGSNDSSSSSIGLNDCLNSSIASSDQSINQNPPNDDSDMQPGPSTSRAPSTTRQNSSNNNIPISRLLNRKIPSCRFPDKYVLYCFDKKLIPKCIKDRYKTVDIPSRLKKSSIYLWIKPSVIASTKIDVEDGNNNELPYYIVRIGTTRTMRPSEFVTALYFGENVSTCEKRETLMGSILVIPLKNPDLAMIYCFGNVTSLINKFAIVKHFGLKITASKDICKNPYRIKELMVETPYDYNKKTKTTKTSELETIEVFTPATGAEFFRMMRVKPDGVKRLVKGSDRFEFYLSVPKEASTTSHASCLPTFTQTLIEISQVLYEIYKKEQIHIEYKDFIAKEIEDTDTKKMLNNQLVTILKKNRASYDNHYLCLNPEVFHWGLGTQLQYWANNVDGNVRNLINSGQFLDALNDTMQEPGADLESTINLTNNKKMIEAEYVFALLIANVIEYNGHFYHFVFGRWFLIPDSRYNFVKTAIERKKLEYHDLGLIQYTKDQDTIERLTIIRKKQIYKELRYNTDAVKALSQLQISALKGILIDRILIPWPKRKYTETFEFGDIFITDNRQILPSELHYIVHVKRRNSSDFEKQCNQVMRCAEFLCKVLTNKLYISLMLQGCINSLYGSHRIDLIGKHVRNSNELTHKQKITVGNDNWQTKVIEAIKQHTNDQTDFHIGMRNMADEFFKTYKILNEHKRECVSAINALFDCYEKDNQNVTFDEAQNFFKTVEHFIGVAEELLGKAKLNKQTRKKTYIIFAIIDDSKEPVEIDPESGLPNYFTYNELLGLELALQKIEGLGFQFRWTWIENDFKVTKKINSKGKTSQTSQNSERKKRIKN